MKHQDRDPVILITGASSGIGEATAFLFARSGYRVILAARRGKLLKRIAEQIIQSGGKALAVEMDVTRRVDIQNLIAAALDQYGQIDVLFNNAGIGRLNWLESLHPQEDVAGLLAANLTGMIWTTQAVLPHMITRRQGHIINMGSVAGFIGTPMYTIYAAAKFGVRGFSEALRREVRTHNIYVSGIYPGGVANDFLKEAVVVRKTGIRTPRWLELSSQQVAESVYRLVKHPRRMVIIPWPMRLAVGINALMPGAVDWIVERFLVRLERS